MKQLQIQMTVPGLESSGSSKLSGDDYRVVVPPTKLVSVRTYADQSTVAHQEKAPT